MTDATRLPYDRADLDALRDALNAWDGKARCADGWRRRFEDVYGMSLAEWEDDFLLRLATALPDERARIAQGLAELEAGAVVSFEDVFNEPLEGNREEGAD